MFHIQTYYLLCVIDLFYFYNVTDFIGYRDILLIPVDWNSENFTLVHHNHYIYIPFSLLNTDIGKILESNIFYVGRKKNLLAFESKKENLIKIINLESRKLMSTINISSQDSFTFAPQTNSDNLWRFQTYSQSSEKPRVLSLIASIDLKGQSTQSPVEIRLHEFRTWHLISLFEWNKFIFVGFRFSDTISIMLRIQPIPVGYGNELQLEHLVTTFSPRNGPNEFIGFLPLSHEPMIYTTSSSSSGQITFYSQPLSVYLERIEIAQEKCSRGEEDESFIDLTSLIQDTRENKKCEKDKMFFVKSTSMRECWIEDSISNSPLKVFSLNHELEEKRIILAKKTDLLCRYDIEGCPPPQPLFIQDTIHQAMNSIKASTIDTVKGLIVLAIEDTKNGTKSPEIDMKLISPVNCSDFTSCPPCVMLGYYRNCSWNSIASKCIEYSDMKSISDKNICFKPFTAKSYSIDGSSLKIIVPLSYPLKLEYGEKVYIIMNQERYDDVKYISSHYEVTMRESKSDTGSIHVYRATGGEMITDFYIYPGGRSFFFWILAGFFFLFLLVVGLLVFLIKTKPNHRNRQSSLGSPKTFGAQVMIRTASESSRKVEEPLPILPASGSSDSPETPEPPTFSELKAKRIRSSDSEGQFPRESHSEH